MSVTVSGPGCDEKRESTVVGISLATTHANRAAMRREEATFYVRDESGTVVGTAESNERGGVTIQGTASLA